MLGTGQEHTATASLPKRCSRRLAIETPLPGMHDSRGVFIAIEAGAI
jgi:hypothetical protein